MLDANASGIRGGLELRIDGTQASVQRPGRALTGVVWWALASPILMTVLLLKVSGVSLLEQDIADRRPGYAEYVRRTSPFIPRPPRP